MGFELTTLGSWAQSSIAELRVPRNIKKKGNKKQNKTKQTNQKNKQKNKN